VCKDFVQPGPLELCLPISTGAPSGVRAEGATDSPTEQKSCEWVAQTAQQRINSDSFDREEAGDGFLDSALHNASFLGNTNDVSYILSIGVPVNQRASNGITPLWITAFSNRPEVAEVR